MSDLWMNESQLEDIAWKEFGGNEDHIVPHTGGKKHGFPVVSESSKRPRYELSCVEGTSDNKIASDNVIQRENTSFNAAKEDKEKMLENGPWSHSSSEAFSAPSDGDSNRKTPCSTSDEDRTSNQCIRSSNMDTMRAELCVDDHILGDRVAAVDSNLFPYQLDNASHTENDLSFLGNDLQEKEGNDGLYYTWAEIENFEDVDRMFRSCDSTFGLGLDNDDELGWFSSSHEIEGSDDALKSSFNFSGCDPSAINSLSQDQKAYGMTNTGLLINDTDQKLAPVGWNTGSQKLTPSGSPTAKNPSYAYESGTVAHFDSDLQTCSHVSQSKQQQPSEGKRKELSSENGDTFINLDDLKQVGESDYSLKIQHNLSAETHQKHNTTHQTCLQTSVPLIKANKSHPSNHVLTSPRSFKIKSEDTGHPSIAPTDSLYGSNQMRSTESSHVVSFQKPAVSGNKKKERLHQRRLSGHLEKSRITSQTADSDPVSSCKQVPNSESEVEGQSEVNGTEGGIPGEMDSSNIQESSCVSSVLDEVSIEASSFQQLQHVMEQLDIRTKLCIRDSLYRLARSAEQRHKCITGGRDDKVASGAVIPDETNKCVGFMDIETDTNPIDRSIAHLLFHRPSDPSATGALDAVPAKAHTMVQAPNNGAVMAKKLVSQEETTSANSEAAEQ